MQKIYLLVTDRRTSLQIKIKKFFRENDIECSIIGGFFLFSIDVSILSSNQCKRALVIFDRPILNASPGAAYKFDLQSCAPLRHLSISYLCQADQTIRRLDCIAEIGT